MADNVNHPAHYKGVSGVECIEAIESMGCGVDFCRANAVKYLWRLGKRASHLRMRRKPSGTSTDWWRTWKMEGTRMPKNTPYIEFPAGMTAEQIEKEAVTQSLIRHKGNRTRAAKELGLSTRTVQRKLKRWAKEKAWAATNGRIDALGPARQ